MTATVSALGALLGDPTRAQLLTCLLDGRARTVGELARAAGVSVSTSSEHLARLRVGGLLTVQAQGRHRYHRLAGPDVAHLLETAMVLSTASGSMVAEPRVPQELRAARTCYDHLAGALAVALHERLVRPSEGGPRLTVNGRQALATLGVDVGALSQGRRPLLRDCLDWSERRAHLAGAVGAALLATFLDRGHLARRQTRAVRVTASGRDALHDALGAHPCWTSVPRGVDPAPF